MIGRIQECIRIRKDVLGCQDLHANNMRPQMPCDTQQFLQSFEIVRLLRTRNPYPVLCRTKKSLKPARLFVIKFLLDDKKNLPIANQEDEIDLHVLFSHLVADEITPHIVLPIASLQLEAVDVQRLLWSQCLHPKQASSEDASILFEDWCKRHAAKPKAHALLMEYCSHGDWEHFLNSNPSGYSSEQWQSCLAQAILTLAILQNHFSKIRINDGHLGNWLVAPVATDRIHTYEVQSYKFRVPTYGIELRLFDFEYVYLPRVLENPKAMQPKYASFGIVPCKNDYYDLHLLCNDLLNHFQSCMPKEVQEVLQRIVPKGYRYKAETKRLGRLKAHDVQVTTPLEVLTTDAFFQKFREHADAPAKF
jgi:hypothetical protein